MDYIAYNEHSQVLARFNTAEEGKAWLNKKRSMYRSFGMPLPLIRLCYNGTVSTEVYRVGPANQATASN